MNKRICGIELKMRKNLRIRGLNCQERIYTTKWTKYLVSGVGHAETEKIKFERIHQIRKPAEMSGETPRDVIARFHYYKDKEQIWTKLKTTPAKYDEPLLQIFPDLAAETLVGTTENTKYSILLGLHSLPNRKERGSVGNTKISGEYGKIL